jgi:hypothetical protein
MFFQDCVSRKREREDDEEGSASGFGAHRNVGLSSHDASLCTNDLKKRRIAPLPHRTSPAVHTSPTFSWSTHYTSQPVPPTITPAHSDSEDKDNDGKAEPRSFFSPFSSPATATLTQSGSPSPYLNDPESFVSSQPTQMSDIAIHSDDFEMTDSIHLSPGPFHADSINNVTGRIPTPIHSSFAPFIRAEKASMHRDADFADDEAMVDKSRRGRRLPSPISEGEMSPSVIVEGFSDMQMDVEGSEERQTPTKKGHSRSKHSLRNWNGLGEGNPSGSKRGFSMGYRADCEKCRMKVPGHFSHIITY